MTTYLHFYFSTIQDIGDAAFIKDSDDCQSVMQQHRPCVSFFCNQVIHKMVIKLHDSGIMSRDYSTLCAHPPLHIEDELPFRSPVPSNQGVVPNPHKKARLMTTFKEVWRPGNAEKSLQETSLYEASVNATWANCLPDGDDQCMRMGSFSQLQECMSLFNPNSDPGRIIFPIVLDAHIDSDSAFKGVYPKSLCLMSGHLVLAAWWFCAYDALESNDESRILSLWQCALSATIRVHVCTSPQEICLFSLRFSEQLRTLAVTTSDNLITFSDKIRQLYIQNQCTGQNLISMLNGAKIGYKGNKMSKVMLAACLSIHSNLNDDSRKTLLFIESRYGRGMLTDGYTKLYRLITFVAARCKLFHPSRDLKHILANVLQLLALFLEINQKTLNPNDINEHFLTGKETTSKKQSKDESSKVPWAQVAVTMLQIFWHAHSTIAALDVKPDGLDSALQYFICARTYHQHLQHAILEDQFDVNQICTHTHMFHFLSHSESQLQSVLFVRVLMWETHVTKSYNLQRNTLIHMSVAH